VAVTTPKGNAGAWIVKIKAELSFYYQGELTILLPYVTHVILQRLGYTTCSSEN
jgi:hypothetical protein